MLWSPEGLRRGSSGWRPMASPNHGWCFHLTLDLDAPSLLLGRLLPSLNLPLVSGWGWLPAEPGLSHCSSCWWLSRRRRSCVGDRVAGDGTGGEGQGGAQGSGVLRMGWDEGCPGHWRAAGTEQEVWAGMGTLHGSRGRGVGSWGGRGGMEKPRARQGSLCGGWGRWREGEGAWGQCPGCPPVPPTPLPQPL